MGDNGGISSPMRDSLPEDEPSVLFFFEEDI
jgi:hypothetical protein